MDDDLPTDFDLIVVGTGFTESVVAAAASRVGKSVLHLDPNDFYGTYWASFNLENIQTLHDASLNIDVQPPEMENNSIKLNDNLCRLQNIIHEWHFPEEEATDGWTKEKVMKDFRKFNIDISPKLLFSRGDLVELLITSNICRYAEFRAVDHITTLMGGNLKSVPCSRSDVFTTKDVSVVEKRLLMKLLSSCLNYEDESSDFKDDDEKSFQDYLMEKKLTSNLSHYVLYAISMGNKNTTCKEGIIKTKKFLSSLGRYGNTPFLFPMYGCGEIPQCFCRLCAVFGGVYCLKRSVKNINFSKDDMKFESIQCDKQQIKSKNIIFGHGTISGAVFEKSVKDNNNQTCGNLSRGIFITDSPLGDESISTGGGGVVFLKIPSENKDRPNGAYVIQLSHYSGACPKGLYIVHITCETITNAKSDIEEYAKQIFKDWDKQNNTISEETETEQPFSPKILWSMFFNIPKCLKCDYSSAMPFDGLHLVCGPYFELDYDHSIEEAKKIFMKIYPDEEFLPRAPDPEEIIIGDEDDETKYLHEEIKEKIADVVEGIENEEKCIEENSLNEDKVGSA